MEISLRIKSLTLDVNPSKLSSKEKQVLENENLYVCWKRGNHKDFTTPVKFTQDPVISTQTKVSYDF